jgi:predicted tellurium resistance membrane protein TerC
MCIQWDIIFAALPINDTPHHLWAAAAILKKIYRPVGLVVVLSIDSMIAIVKATKANPICALALSFGLSFMTKPLFCL